MSLLLVHSDDGASLAALIGAADLTNHAIPTVGELSRALTRLNNVGVISVVDRHYKIESKHLEELEAAKLKRGGRFSLPEKGKKWLCSKSLDFENKGAVTICPEELTDAYNQYIQSLRRSKPKNNPMDPSGGSAVS
jgi:hypothetical protein